MNYDFSLLIYIRFLSGLIAIFLAYFIWRRKLSNGAIYLALFELAAAIWAIFDGLGYASTTIEDRLLWAQVAYIGITTSGVFFLLFSLVYTKKSWFVNRRNIIILFEIPCITLILAFTNQHHKILWREIIIEENQQVVFYYGFWFWIHVFYEYLTLTGGIVLLLIHAFKVYRFYRINIWLLLLGTPLPFCASILYVFKLVPALRSDLTPISFIFTGIIVAISLFWFKLFDIMPLAHKQVIDNLRVGMLVVDPTNRIVDTNPAFNQILNISAGQQIGCNVDAFLSTLKVKIGDFSESNEFTTEAQITVAGEPKYYEVNYQKVFDKNHRIICKIFTLNDVTTKKMILDSLAESNSNRKFELVEKELLIKDLNTYAHTVAHDLKTPINTLIGFSEIIKDKLLANDEEGAIKYLDVLSSQSLKMSKIIDELLKLSTIRKEGIKLSPMESGKSVNEALKMLYYQMSDTKATITKPDAWPMVMGNPQWIEEVWVNLISNAIKYGGTPPKIHIGYEQSSPTTYRFWVRDNGSGLGETSFEKVFEDFERLGRKDVEGHGFGLAIVKRIVEKLGGQVSVSSTNKPGEGCEFSFTLLSCPTN